MFIILILISPVMQCCICIVLHGFFLDNDHSVVRQTTLFSQYFKISGFVDKKKTSAGNGTDDAKYCSTTS